MADISTEIQKIGQAVYGEEVRGAIMDALEAMNTQAAAAQEWATGADDPASEPGETNNAAYYAAQAAAQAAAAAAAIPPDYSELLGAMNDVQKISGIDYAPIGITPELGTYNGNVGETISESTSTIWYKIGIETSGKRDFRITYETYKYNPAIAYVWWCDDEDTILARYTAQHSETGLQETATIQAPVGATRLYMRSHSRTVFGIETLASETMEGQAAQIAGLDTLRVETEAATTIEQGSIRSTNGEEQISTTRCRTGYINLTGTEGVRILVPTGLRVFVHTYSAANQAGYSGPYDSLWHEGGIEIIRGDLHYIRLVVAYTDDADITPSDIQGLIIDTIAYTDTTLTEAGKAADAAAAGDMIRGTSHAFAPGSYTARGGLINGDNLWQSSTVYKYSVIELSGEKLFKVTAPESVNTVIAFLKNDTFAADETPAFAEGESGRRVQVHGTTEYYLVPADAVYLYYHRGSSASGYINTPTEIVGYYTGIGSDILHAAVWSVKNQYDILARTETRDVPKNQGVRNAYKKMMQLQNITYTLPAAITSRNMPAGTYTGMLYSGTADKEHYIGYNVSQRSFMTAIHNPYSGMYTEDVAAPPDSASAYADVVYHGTNCDTPLGIVCAPFVAWVLGMPVKWENHAWPYLESIGVMERLTNQSYSGVELCDMMYYTGHVAIISDIYRDERGEPTRIYITESYRPYVRTKVYTPAEFQAEMQRHNNTTLYRYKYLDRNLEYMPSEFVAVENEPTPPAYEYNDEICPYLGDYSAYNAGDLIAVCYTKGSHTSLILAKDGTDVQTIQLPASADTHTMDLRPYNLTAGSYTARLSGGDVPESAACRFDVLDLPITVEENDDEITVSYDKTKTPVYIQICIQSGAARCVVPLTDTDIAAGSKTFDIRAEIAAQGSTVASGACYAIVMYKVTDPAGYKVTRASEFVPLTWAD